MIPAYDKVYLEKARTALGRMLDFAVYDLKYGLEDFFSLFLASGTADRFEHGDFTLLVGMSGTELAYEVLEQSGIVQKRIRPKYTMNRSEEYWTGWALAYYQWERAGSFSEIVRCVPICRIRELYFPYHEMDIRHFCDRMDEPQGRNGNKSEADEEKCWSEPERAGRADRYLSTYHSAV